MKIFKENNRVITIKDVMDYELHKVTAPTDDVYGININMTKQYGNYDMNSYEFKDFIKPLTYEEANRVFNKLVSLVKKEKYQNGTVSLNQIWYDHSSVNYDSIVYQGFSRKCEGNKGIRIIDGNIRIN